MNRDERGHWMIENANARQRVWRERVEKKKPVLAVDFDGTLVHNGFPDISKAKVDGDMVDFIKLAKDLGWNVFIYSARTNLVINDSEEYFWDMVEFLIDHKIYFDYVEIGRGGKPFWDLLIDDRGCSPETVKKFIHNKDKVSQFLENKFENSNNGWRSR